MAEEKTFLIKIITPERVFYEGTAIMAEFNTSEGEIGVYAGHIPLTVILKPGVLTLTEESGKKKAALHTGFAEILPDQISILAEAAEWPGEIDIKRAEAAQKRAEERLQAHSSDTDMARAETAPLFPKIILKKTESSLKIAAKRKNRWMQPVGGRSCRKEFWTFCKIRRR